VPIAPYNPRNTTDPLEIDYRVKYRISNFDYECDRDVVGAVNVERKHLSESKMEGTNPADSMEILLYPMRA